VAGAKAAVGFNFLAWAAPYPHTDLLGEVASPICNIRLNRFYLVFSLQDVRPFSVILQSCARENHIFRVSPTVRLLYLFGERLRTMRWFVPAVPRSGTRRGPWPWLLLGNLGPVHRLRRRGHRQVQVRGKVSGHHDSQPNALRSLGATRCDFSAYRPSSNTAVGALSARYERTRYSPKPYAGRRVRQDEFSVLIRPIPTFGPSHP